MQGDQTLSHPGYTARLLLENLIHLPRLPLKARTPLKLSSKDISKPKLQFSFMKTPMR